ncbi:Protein argonaute-3 [Fusarium oxysporum f. sp. albedinis]|nr:Protein argonaute-3 [Fusarium oxysporum f. sp. albedinis]
MFNCHSFICCPCLINYPKLRMRQGLSFRSWSANGIRRSWTVITDNNPNRGSLSRSTLLQASPESVRRVAQKLFADERARLGIYGKAIRDHMTVQHKRSSYDKKR